MVASHEAITGNEAADLLARKEGQSVFYGPKPFCANLTKIIVLEEHNRTYTSKDVPETLQHKIGRNFSTR